MTIRKPRKPKTSADAMTQLAEAKKRVLELEAQVFAEKLTDAIQATSIVDEFNKIKFDTKEISNRVVLQALSEAFGMKRILVTETPIQTRNRSAQANKPRKPRVSKKAD